MASSLIDVCRFFPTAGGTTDWTYSSAVTGYQSPSAAGAVNGAQYSYRAESSDLTQWENGVGVFNSSTGVLTRATVFCNSSGTGVSSGQTGAGTKINFTTAPQVAIVALAEDLNFAPAVPGGRLTLSSGVPVMTTDVVAATSIFYAPTTSMLVPIYNGTSLVPYQFTSSNTDAVGLTLALGSNWAASTLYDVFVTLNGGLPALATVAWSSSTAGASTRATALGLFSGIQTNSTSATARISNTTTTTMAANQGTYVGTFLTNSSAGQIDFKFGTTAAGGGAAVAGVWNLYNQTQGAFLVIDSNSNITVSVASTFQPYDVSGTGSGLNNRFTFVSGNGSGIIDAEMTSDMTNAAGAGGFIGLGLNVTNAMWSRSVTGTSTSAASGSNQSITAHGRGYAPAGLNFLQALQYNNSTSSTFGGGSSPAVAGLTATWWY